VEDDNELVARCLKRDPAAEYALFRRFAPKMYGICMRYGGNDAEADEILQSGFIRVFRYLHQYRSEGNLEGWIYRIFVNAAIRYYEQNPKSNEAPEYSNDEAFSTAEEADLTDWSVQDYLEVIQKLPACYRTVFNLYVFEEYRHAEIAELLGITDGHSRSSLFRARKLIRKLLAEKRDRNSIY
jgi:RNA polymerase sigma factor (sigma-70 family)